ncbi:hypothetical protein TUMEXPCC7403_22540 [Tumidithrix helvetica PCC 7403]
MILLIRDDSSNMKPHLILQYQKLWQAVVTNLNYWILIVN